MRAQLKARPSRNLGNSSSTRAKRPTSSPNACGSSSDFKRMPNGVLRARSWSRSFLKCARVTVTAPSGSAASSLMRVNPSAASTARPSSTRMSGIGLFQIGHVLERLHAEAAIGVEEAFAILAFAQIQVDHAFHRIGDLVFAETGAHDGADRGVFGAAAAQ